MNGRDTIWPYIEDNPDIQSIYQNKLFPIVRSFPALALALALCTRTVHSHCALALCTGARFARRSLSSPGRSLRSHH